MISTPRTSMPRLPKPFAPFAVLLVLVAPSALRAATTCTTDCAQTACSVDCSEADVRDAVAKANACTGNPAWTGRTISVATSPATPCTIEMVNDANSAVAVPGSYCASDHEVYAVCFTNSNIVFEGNNAKFLYTGTAFCGQCGDECPPPQPALFTIKGQSNTLQNLSYRYFPEGIHIRAGNNHVVQDVTSDRICEDAITVDLNSGSGHVIRRVHLIGSTTPDPPHTCGLANGSNGVCGTDKAIQLNGGGSTIEDSTIDMISQPIGGGGGTHLVKNNTSHGSENDQNVCQSYTVSGSATVTLQQNTIDHCKFGIRVDDTALVIASDNTITNPWVSAFDVRANGRLKASGNRLKTRAGGFTNVSSVQRGLIVARNGSGARIDLGGGDFAGVSVVNNLPCASGGDCSTGQNKFCAVGTGAQTAIWNITDCPCVNRLCNNSLGNCTVDSCAPLDRDGSCLGSAGSGASVGNRSNCARTTGAAPLDVKDTGTSSTATAALGVCSAVDCDF